MGQQMRECIDWLVTSVNTLVGQNLTLQQGFTALSNPQVDPTTSQIKTGGSRISSLTTGFGFTATTTTITIYWDGTNSSTVLRVYRDDGSVSGPFPGSQLITGLIANTKYFFYPYFDEATKRVLFVSQPGAVGSPPIAYTTQAIVNAIAQIFRGRTPLASNLADTGIMTPAAGSTPATVIGGSGGGPGGFLGRNLLQ